MLPRRCARVAAAAAAAAARRSARRRRPVLLPSPRAAAEEARTIRRASAARFSSAPASSPPPPPPPSPWCPVHSSDAEVGVAWADDSGHAIHKHCATCTCGAVNVGETSDREHGHDRDREYHDPSCSISSSLREPLPPPLPEPKFSFHKRVLPPNLTALSSPLGKRLFLESLSTGDAECYFPLAEQFLNQSDPAFCGVTTLCMVLNAMSVDPGVRWRGGWRWYGDDSVVLSNCCLDMERVRRAGISVEEFVSLGRCQGAAIVARRPIEPDGSDGGPRRGDGEDGRYGVERFRDDVRFMVRHPPPYVAEDDGDGAAASTSPSGSDAGGGGFLVVSYARHALSQTGEGHYSPVAAYHPPTDRALILDVARFKYAPYWVSVPCLYDAMIPVDPTTGLSRGWLLLHPPRVVPRARVGGYHGPKKTDEGKRPAEMVRKVGEGDICPLGEIKVEFCPAGESRSRGEESDRTVDVGRTRGATLSGALPKDETR